MGPFNRYRFACLVALCGLLLFERPILSQGNMIVEMEPATVRHLAGIVTDPTGAAISQATVEDCDSTFGTIMAVGKTDRKGRFSLPQAKPGTHHYLQVISRGFNLTRIPVIIDRSGKNELRIRLTLGT
ncbi:MAG TPA: carboxypeptidase-like regulatory domain-containing protein [Terracidiphilus sp.]|nr:carboxypeptidase-like regulatory domain-containing protein [Terracidiphilus sp.]